MSGRNHPLVSLVAAAIAKADVGARRIVLGLSGGVDSVVLLHLLRRGLGLPPSRLSALHVNHGLSPHARSWEGFCRQYCKSLGLRLQVARVTVKHGNSTEAAARSARYDAFSRCGAPVVALAHNRDDQAETVLLQLLRGSGPRGLSAMPALRTAAGDWMLWRPLLDSTRHAILDYARSHNLQWVEDESNRDRSYLRNFLRHDVLPLLGSRQPGVIANLARAARLQAEASEMMDVLAETDWGADIRSGALPVEKLAGLPAARARNLLRYFLRCQGAVMPASDRLEELLRQALHAKADARISIVLERHALHRFQGRLHLVRLLPALDPTFRVDWTARAAQPLPQWGGVLRLERRKGEGLAMHWLESPGWTIRVRQGGEAIRLAKKGARRTLRNLMQEAAIPPWMRDRWPLLYLRSTLVAVPGIGMDERFSCDPEAWGRVPLWRPEGMFPDRRDE